MKKKLPRGCLGNFSKESFKLCQSCVRFPLVLPGEIPGGKFVGGNKLPGENSPGENLSAEINCRGKNCRGKFYHLFQNGKGI